MTWIKTIPPSQAEGKLLEALEKQRALYPPEYGRRGTSPETNPAGSSRPTR